MAYNNSALLQQQRLKAMQGLLGAQPVSIPTNGSFSSSKQAEKQAKEDNSWQKMLQSAALASMMDNKTALGFGLGTLLFGALDRWNNRNKKTATPTEQFDFSKNMEIAKDPMKLAANGGDPTANWVLQRQGSVSTNGNPPESYTLTASNQPLNTQPTQNNGFLGNLVNSPKDGVMSLQDSNLNPANFANYAKAIGASPSPYSSSYRLADTDWMKKPWEAK